MSTKLIPPLLGQNLMRLRESRGFTIAECCLTLNIARGVWEGWEKSTGEPGYNSLIRICHFLRYYDIFKLLTEEMRFKGQAPTQLLTENSMQ